MRRACRFLPIALFGIAFAAAPGPVGAADEPKGKPAALKVSSVPNDEYPKAFRFFKLYR